MTSRRMEIAYRVLGILDLALERTSLAVTTSIISNPAQARYGTLMKKHPQDWKLWVGFARLLADIVTRVRERALAREASRESSYIAARYLRFTLVHISRLSRGSKKGMKMEIKRS